MARIVVTGASGFIGTSLTRRLLADGHDVAVLLHRREPTRDAFAGLRQLRADVTDPQSLRGKFDGCDLVFHLAGCTIARSRKQFMDVNCRGTVNVAQACTQATTPPKLMFVSSLAAVGPAVADVPLAEDAPARPVSEYGRSKLAAERELQSLADRLAIQIVRPPSVMGDADPYMLSLFKAAKAGWVFLPGTMFLPRATPHRYSLIHLDDLIAAMVQLAWRDDVRLAPLSPSSGSPGPESSRRGRSSDHRQPGDTKLAARVGANPGIVHLAQDPPLSFVETAQAVCNLFAQRPVRVVGVPASLCWTVAAANTFLSRLIGNRPLLNLDKMREGMAGPWMADSTRLTADLGFRFPDALESRIRQTAEGYQDRGWL